ncbi:NAD(P)-binding protein, partial [Listeria monocytogenes]|nr:NAD(P)-binding protein [Listeria monocytogenes]
EMIVVRIAILGAGISGLSCAFRLEQLGFQGEIEIFEEKGGIGVGTVYAEFISEMFHRPLRDILTYLNHKYSLYLRPAQTIYGAINYG